MLLSDFIRSGAQALESLYPSPEARGMVLMLCEDRLGVKSYTHVVDPGFEIPHDRLEGLQEDLSRLLDGEPLQYVTGTCEFFGRRFNVSPAVLIPRPETEILVREAVTRALDLDRPLRVLDLCTGSGCIAWSVALEVPYAELVGVDISDAALEVARSQFDSPGVSFIKADVLDASADFGPGSFDMILSNPPYIMESEKALMRSNVLDHEPEIALFVPDSDPLVFYRAVAGAASRLLVPGGSGIVEINEQLGSATADVFKAAGLQKVEIMKDFFGKDRFVSFEKQASRAV